MWILLHKCIRLNSTSHEAVSPVQCFTAFHSCIMFMMQFSLAVMVFHVSLIFKIVCITELQLFCVAVDWMSSDENSLI